MRSAHDIQGCVSHAQVMRYEAVHPIDGWLELRSRLAPNRRVFGFFHASMPGEPLVLLHTALMPTPPATIDQVFLQNTHGAQQAPAPSPGPAHAE